MPQRELPALACEVADRAAVRQRTRMEPPPQAPGHLQPGVGCPHRAPECSISVFQEAPNPVQGVPEQPIAVVLSLQIESMLPIVVATPHERPLESRIAAAHENQCRPESPITAEGRARRAEVRSAETATSRR